MSEKVNKSRKTAPEEEKLGRGSKVIQHSHATRFAHQLFEEQAARTPDKLAVVCSGRRLSYGELNTRANQLACHLRHLGVRANTRVAISVERSLEMVVGIIGVLKAGGAYVPLDPGYPQERLELMIADSQPAIFLTQSHLIGNMPQLPARVLLLDAVSYASGNKDLDDSTPNAEADLAYVIYTSGSTGRPKGVMITQGNLGSYVRSMQQATGVTATDVYLHTASISFSSSVRQLLLPLSVGASVVVATRDEIGAPLVLFATIKEQGVTVIDLVPSYWRSCIEALRMLSAEARAALLQSELRLILSASEPLLSDVPHAWRFELEHQAQLINMFGQTETTGIVATYPIVPGNEDQATVVPVGRPIKDAWIYLLDAELRPVEFGNAGEICIGGATVGSGYLNQPELTAEKFPRDPFAGNKDARLYRTGDLGKLRADGTLEFHGRIDNQVKIRGHRVEPAETEAALLQHPGVHEVAVTANTDEQGNSRLVAYIGLHPIAAASISGRERYRLPNNMAVLQQNKHETDFFYQQIFVDQTNFRHGITLQDGACVFDVGANIGFFTLFVQQLWQNVRVYAFEPIPAIFDTLRINTSLYRNSAGDEARLFQCGLAESARDVDFTFYPNSTSQSGRYGDEKDEREVLRSIIGNLKQEESNGDKANNQYFDALVESRVCGEKIVCPLRTLSEIIHEEHVERIDLLKIDVEKSESDVLAGIAEEDWPKIRQIVIEAHDIDGQLGRLLQLLRDRGYQVIAEQDDCLKGSNLYNVYATRSHDAIKPATNGQRPAKTNILEVPSYEVPVLEEAILSSGELRRLMQDKLPDYLVPTEYVFVEGLPRLPNGKVDRQALKAIVRQNGAGEDFVAPHSLVEEQLARIWREVLKRDAISTRDNFFDLGGDSILVMQIVSRAARAGLRLTPKLIFKHQTIAELAALLAVVAEIVAG